MSQCCSAGRGCHEPLEPRNHPRLDRDSWICHIASSARDETFSNLLLSITKAMGDVQKKLQDLSDAYQNFQAGKMPEKLHQCSLISWWGRALDSRRGSPETRIAAAGEHNRQEGIEIKTKGLDDTNVSIIRNSTSSTTMRTYTSKSAQCC
jgi:hypothetical protein